MINLTDLKTKAEAATPGEWVSDPFGCYVFAPSEKGGQFPVADTHDEKPDQVVRIRGWGHFTGTGHGALGLSHEEAIERQKANAAYIAATSPADMLPLINALIEWRDAWTNMEDNWRTTNRIGEAHDALLALISGKPTQETTP